MRAVWHIHPSDPPRAAALAKAVDIHPLTAQLLLNRGLRDGAAARRFLQPTLHTLTSPDELPDMRAAVARLRQAIARREPILVFSDSDVDGLTAGAILYEVLKELGAIVRAKHANRIADGYGLPPALVQRLCRSSVKVLLVVDCGTNQAEDIRRLASHGIATLVVDHHVPLEGWARPHALLNPYAGSGAGRELSSAGLAFKVAQALLGGATAERLPAYLDLAALGTLADCVPLVGDNRAIVAAGLPRIAHSERPGLARLCRLTGVREGDAVQILRRLTPKLNASGRLGDPVAVWRLLLRDGPQPLETSLAATEAAHETTKQLYRRIIAEAEAQVSRLHFKDHDVLLVSRRGWHQGLMGPLAAQLAQRYGRPAIAIAMEERQGVGSGRSVPSFNLLEALTACRELLVRFGGHAQACGLTVDWAQLERFRERVNETAKRTLGPAGWLAPMAVDLELPLSAIARRWVREAEHLAPFGQGNLRPTVAIRRVRIEVTSPRIAVCSEGGMRLAAKGSFAALTSGERYDVVATPALAGEELTLTVSDVRDAAGPSRSARTSGTPYTPGSV